MALGTKTIGRVDLIAGPGNAYVAEAKRQLFGEVGIDLFAGPTEILVIADNAADPFVVAVDLLSQAEHGPDSPAVLITTSETVAREALAHIEKILFDMPTRDFAGPAWRDHGQILLVDTIEEAFTLADSFAFEHVQVLTAEPRRALEEMTNYGALFLGEGTCVSYGDQGDRYQPRAADPRRRAVHRGSVGRKIPQDRHLPGGHQQRLQRRAGRTVRARGPGRVLRGARQVRRCARREVRHRRTVVDRSRRPRGSGRCLRCPGHHCPVEPRCPAARRW